MTLTRILNLIANYPILASNNKTSKPNHFWKGKRSQSRTQNKLTNLKENQKLIAGRIKAPVKLKLSSEAKARSARDNLCWKGTSSQPKSQEFKIKQTRTHTRWPARWRILIKLEEQVTCRQWETMWTRSLNKLWIKIKRTQGILIQPFQTKTFKKSKLQSLRTWTTILTWDTIKLQESSYPLMISSNNLISCTGTVTTWEENNSLITWTQSLKKWGKAWTLMTSSSVWYRSRNTMALPMSTFIIQNLKFHFCWKSN